MTTKQLIELKKLGKDYKNCYKHAPQKFFQYLFTAAFMNKKQLLQVMASDTGVSQSQLKPQLEQILIQLHKALAEGEKVYLPQFGTFELRYHLAKNGRNPQTGESIEIPGFNQPSFKPAPAFKKYINP
ncbi:HU family DNA-binding protein [Shewanella sp. UCD-FRSSP16_17]|uniref:HU family DNA-binding protein n=1 Tax=Shewanella sp. UCD-FRSSP16_17 TaxID=1853256 RepID=UPI002F9162C5